jgi:hypothetical protein
MNIEMIRDDLAEVYSGNPPGALDLGPYPQAQAKAGKQSSTSGLWTINMFLRGIGVK